MKISLKNTNIIFFVSFIIPILIMGLFVSKRIGQQQISAQLFLQNQVDVERKIIGVREILRETQSKIRNTLLNSSNGQQLRDARFSISEDRRKLDEFWKKYNSSFLASERPFLLSILEKTKETNLIDEETEALNAILKAQDQYFQAIITRLDQEIALGNSGNQDRVRFLENVEQLRMEVYRFINQITDIRYVFAQRIIFYITGENSTQQGMFNTAFLGILFAVLTVGTVQYFIISRPLGDILMFLRDTSHGKKGQRLYFSSPI